ncbi:nuclease [Calothrix sp. NIES-4071]|nr:nuclease [Calothrix sp. NIES-4071]BAZ62943.1 nuclease [Calothrix sp. NIES-4105]
MIKAFIQTTFALALLGSLIPVFAKQSSFVSVVRVKDGDGVVVNKNGKEVEVHLACIDAPEPTQPWGQESTEKLKQLLPPGQKVELRETGKDRYNRTVAELFLNGQSVNLRMVQDGDAVVYPEYLNNCESTKNQYWQAEGYAKIQKSGFWSQENLVMPWDFRRGKRNTQANSHSPAPVTNLPACVSRDCNCNFNDFESYEQAQVVLKAFPGDPFDLDRNNDGEACESLR